MLGASGTRLDMMVMLKADKPNKGSQASLESGSRSSRVPSICTSLDAIRLRRHAALACRMALTAPRSTTTRRCRECVWASHLQDGAWTAQRPMRDLRLVYFKLTSHDGGFSGSERTISKVSVFPFSVLEQQRQSEAASKSQFGGIPFTAGQGKPILPAMPEWIRRQLQRTQDRPRTTEIQGLPQPKTISASPFFYLGLASLASWTPIHPEQDPEFCPEVSSRSALN
ncbi:hypothetical protein F4803DRAFT_551846 [Xylaria telfairii]|nr:hypothetical protein F4803DRAFT_551846 [Xylaria telfairii]